MHLRADIGEDTTCCPCFHSSQARRKKQSLEETLVASCCSFFGGGLCASIKYIKHISIKLKFVMGEYCLARTLELNIVPVAVQQHFPENGRFDVLAELLAQPVPHPWRTSCKRWRQSKTTQKLGAIGALLGMDQVVKAYHPLRI